ncbi:N-acetylmuramoyl-L-alanine amidase [Chitinophaga skermanii]|nr:N-acetylmuramoyl-L-alanine amidase [Chitinophaga skermanii]
MRKILWKCVAMVILASFITQAYAQQKPYIRLTQPSRTSSSVGTTRQYIVGSTCIGCSLTLNNTPQKVYPTGAFAIEVALNEGANNFTLTSTDSAGTYTDKTVSFTYTKAQPATPVSTLTIASIQTIPDGDQILAPGDLIKFKVKALPGGIVRVGNKLQLAELPVNKSNSMPGIYQGTYMVTCNDPVLTGGTIPVTLEKNGQTVTRNTSNKFSVLNTLDQPLIGKATGELPYLKYGLGDDRLGGAKVGYIDSAVLLNIVGKAGDDYKVRLSKSFTAYIPASQVELMPAGTFIPSSNTGSWRVFGDEKYDYVTVQLQQRLPFRSFQQINPSKIMVDIYGATSNTNWISQLENAEEIKDVYYEQVEDDVFRVIIELKHNQHWGHQVYYNGSMLTIRVKRPPAQKTLKDLTIAVDAGHGGSNPGSQGPTGIYEKDMTLLIAKDVQNILQAEGAKVLMTRVNDSYVDNTYRIAYYRERDPDLLVSIHLNSSADPIRISGTSTYYRHIGFKDLSKAINKRMLGLGLNEFGNIGSFNFALNAPTEYPNALVETLFISNPEDEMKVLDPAFREQMAQSIVAGIKDFLVSAN